MDPVIKWGQILHMITTMVSYNDGFIRRKVNPLFMWRPNPTKKDFFDKAYPIFKNKNYFVLGIFTIPIKITIENPIFLIVVYHANKNYATYKFW